MVANMIIVSGAAYVADNMNILKIMKIYRLINGKIVRSSRKNFMDCKIRKVL